ncbi:uncharacterized protein [Panulirus ornatus]|uniref:uncharacterized protein n=1 Tax=Panulirus ornatus TaxID=150431 RepID=UPI003A88131B
MMASQDDLGMLWYGVTGVSFNPADPAEVMLNTGTTAPLLSDHPRPLVPTPVSYSEPTATQQTQMLYDPNTGDYITQPDYMYESYDGYDEDSSSSQVMQQQGTPPITDPGMVGQADESPPPVPKSKKPKVHHHPALKLKTPIAYQKDTDINAIPIMREGMAVCEKCGAIGVKHAFYGKERKFCSLSCARGPLPPSQQSVENHVVEKDISQEPEKKVIPVQKVIGQPATVPPKELSPPPTVASPSKPSQVVHPQPSVVPPEPLASPTYLPPPECTVDLEGSFSWSIPYLSDTNFRAVPVSCFRHAPMSECWEQMSAGMKVEVACGEEGVTKDAFWVATVVAIAAAREGNDKPIHEDHLLCRPGLNVEVVDKNRIAQMRVATVTEVVGKRLHLKYHGAPPDDNGFWCHEDAPIIHPVGWSREVGHEIVASQSYHEKCIRGTYDPNDAPPELFMMASIPPYFRNSKMAFHEGMKLEAIDPLNLSAICVATVMKVLHNNYLMIRIDSYESDDTCSDWFCYHATSPCVFPAGFCEMNSIPLTPPRGYEGQFSWFTYLKKTQATAAPPALFSREVASHGFEEGMALESADLMDPRLVCVATVKEVKGRLLKVHFDGWESDFDQWIDYQSPDIYPVGWCDMSGYRLEGPKSQVITTLAPKRKVKGGAKVGKTGRRGRPLGSKKFGKVTGVMQSGPAAATAGSQRRRGRPPKEKGQSVVTGFTESPLVQDKSIENENSDLLPSLEVEHSSAAIRGRRVHARKDARRSPRGTSTMASNTKTLPVRATRARTLPASYSQSDEEDISDETSSGVASLDGNESSQEPWDVDERMCNPSVSPSLPVTEVHSISTQQSLTCPSIQESRVQDFKTQTVHSGQKSVHGSNSQSVSVELDKGEPVLNSKQQDLKGSEHTVQATIQTLSTQTVSKGSKVSASLKSSTGASTSSDPKESSEPQVSTQLPALKNGIFQQSKTTSQSPIVSSTVTSQAESSPHVSLLSSAVQKDSENRLYIPRLIDGPIKDGSKVQPKLWTPQDVAQFLKTNDCGAYCDNFVSQNIHGSKLLTLSQNEVMGLTGMKVGPSLKIHDLVQQLLALVNPAQARYQATLMKRGLSFT